MWCWRVSVKCGEVRNGGVLGTSVWCKRVSVKCGEVREWWGVGDECWRGAGGVLEQL